jgi:hypothetical protein
MKQGSLMYCPPPIYWTSFSCLNGIPWRVHEKLTISQSRNTPTYMELQDCQGCSYSRLAEYSSLLGYDNVSLILNDHSAFIFWAMRSKKSDPVAEGMMNLQNIRHCLPSDPLYSNTQAHNASKTASHMSVSWTPWIETTFSHHLLKIHKTLWTSVPTSLLPSHDHTNNFKWRLEFMKLLILQFPPASCCLLPFISVVLNWEYPKHHKAVCEMIFYALSNTD